MGGDKNTYRGGRSNRGSVINVVSGADQNYNLPLATMLHSLLTNIDSRVSVRLFLLDGGLTPDTRRRLTELVARHRVPTTITWLTPELSRFDQLRTLPYISPVAYARLVLPDLLPEVGRVLYLDADLIVRGDVVELWETDLHGRTVGAVQDFGVPVVSARYGIRSYEELGMAPTQPYFYIGVMLVDLNAWRTQQLGARAFQYLHDYADTLQIGEQEAINVALQDQWYRLDARWNVTTEYFRNREQPRAHPSHTGDTWECGEIEDAERTAAIVHYTSESKPWDSECSHPLSQLFHDYLYDSGWLQPFERVTWWSRYWIGRAWWFLRVKTRPVRIHVPLLHRSP